MSNNSNPAPCASCTDWEKPDFRNDVYWPVCYDAVGTKIYLKAIMDAAREAPRRARAKKRSRSEPAGTDRRLYLGN